MTLAILDARDKEYVLVAAGADIIASYVQQAIAAGQTAQEVLDAILAAGLSEGVFPSLAAGESGTTAGQYFWVGDAGTVVLYRNDAGVGTEIAELATAASLAGKVDNAALASSTGGEMVGWKRLPDNELMTLDQKMGLRIDLEEFSEDFASCGNGVHDDTPAFVAAINYMNSLRGGVYLFLSPSKTYKVAGSLPAFVKNRLFVVGQGSRITHDTGTLFTWGDGTPSSVLGGGVIGVDYLGANPPTAGTCFAEQSGANVITFQNITGDRVNQFLKAGTTAYAGGYSLINVRLTTYNAAVNVIEHGDGANSYISGLDMTASGASGVNRVLDETTLTNALATAIKFGAGNWDTCVWSGLLINGYRYGLDVERTSANETVSNFEASNFFFDYCSEGIRLKNTATGGGINNMTFVNGWVVGMDGYGVHLDGAVGSHRTIQFIGVHSLLAGKCNWRLNSQTMDGVRLLNCTGSFANRLNGSNTGSDQDDFVALYGGWEVRNSRFGRSADNIVTSSVPKWQGRYGATGPTAAADYVFEGNWITGKTGDTQFLISSNTLTAGKLFSSAVKDNRVPGGAARPSYAVTAVVAAPTSGAVQTNNTPFHYELYLYGGTVTAIAKNSTTVADTVPARLDISPGDTWSVTYSSAPTLKRVIKP